MIELNGRKVKKDVAFEEGLTILDLALKHDVDWGFACTRGTCARCRCLVVEGSECLGSATEAEKDRLEPEEIEAGYRLGCQVVMVREGKVVVTNKPYF